METLAVVLVVVILIIGCIVFVLLEFNKILRQLNEKLQEKTELVEENPLTQKIYINLTDWYAIREKDIVEVNNDGTTIYYYEGGKRSIPHSKVVSIYEFPKK